MSHYVGNREEIMKKILMSSDNPVASHLPINLPELVSIRRKSGLTLQQISDATKIPMRYLQAIEDGSLSQLPGGVYTSNYLRQYAELCRNPPALS